MSADDALDNLAAQLGAALKARGARLVTAESCTGGWVAQCVTSIAGSSDWYDRGFITYSNASKEELLGVRRATLEAQGAVSEQTAREMAAGALERSRADVAVAVTGVAGPGGGTPAKPVGMVCFAWVARGTSPHSATRSFPGDRASVRRQSVIAALEGVIGEMEQTR
jgi:nicotinamide-nucleotide amidase